MRFPSLGLTRTLKTGENAVIIFTPKKAGTIRFTCGMSMYQGTVLVR